MTQPELVVFDWDGTLVDSVGHIVACMQGASADAGLTVPDEARARDVIGLGLGDALSQLFPGEQDPDLIARMVTAYRDRYLSAGPEAAAPFAGVRELLAELHLSGLRLAVATGKSREGLDKAFDQTGLSVYFESVRCADERLAKPHPAMLEEILAETGVPAGRALMVGDSVHDLNMARAARVGGVGVMTGAHDDLRLRCCDPLEVLPSAVHLSPWLHNSRGVFRSGIGN